MADRPFDVEVYVDAAAALIGLPLDPAHRPGVVLNMQRIAEMAGWSWPFRCPRRPSRRRSFCRERWASRRRRCADHRRRGAKRRGQRGRGRGGDAGADCGPRPRPQQLHRDHPGTRAGRCPRRRRCARAGRGSRAARRCALRREEPLRYRRAGHHRRVEDRPRRRAGDSGRHDRPASGKRRSDPRRRPQHGRIRLRLHHREHALRRGAQSPRPGPIRRRVVGRVGCGGRRRPCAVRARLGHQRLDPRAGFAVRHLWAEADLRPPQPRRRTACSPPASTMSARWRVRSAISPPSTTRCRDPIRSIRPAPAARSSRHCRSSITVPPGCASPSPAGISPAAGRPRRRWRRSRGRSASPGRSRSPKQPGRAPPPL